MKNHYKTPTKYGFGKDNRNLTDIKGRQGG
jgi:hypothetical protein